MTSLIRAVLPGATLDGTVIEAMTTSAEEWDLSWTEKVKGKHKAVFDIIEHANGVGVLRAAFWGNQYIDVMKAAPVDLSTILVLRHNAIILAMNQAFWDKYNIGPLKEVRHPMTDEHRRIYAENALIQNLNDAMSFRKVKEMREMLVEYRKLDPTDVDAHQAGYEVIADCIEFPGDASLAAARQFYDTERHSPLRRFVRRICFENSN